MRWWLALVVLLGVQMAIAAPIDNCTEVVSSGVYLSFDGYSWVQETYGLTVKNICMQSAEIVWDGAVNLSLGNITEGEVILGDGFIYVDSAARPDLDRPATLTFKNVPYMLEPAVLRDGEVCGDCVVDFNQAAKTVLVDVSGFSNYSLEARKDFTLYSDAQPELASKVYQTIDLGDGNRSEVFKCIVQIYGRNEGGEYVLVQTNPKRDVVAKPFGNPDPNLPESLGYFKTENGLANVYYDGAALAGYEELEYVAQCAGNSSKYVYEEPISTRYKPVGRSLVGRGIWLASGGNAFYLVIAVVLGVLGFILLLKIAGMFYGIWRGS
jgi:hypothetical protein